VVAGLADPNVAKELLVRGGVDNPNVDEGAPGPCNMIIGDCNPNPDVAPPNPCEPEVDPNPDEGPPKACALEADPNPDEGPPNNERELGDDEVFPNDDAVVICFGGFNEPNIAVFDVAPNVDGGAVIGAGFGALVQ